MLANSGKPEDKKFTFRGPVDFVNIMTSSSVEVANLANNHSYDFGAPGYVRLAYCVSYEQIERSLPAFRRLIEEYKGEN